MANFWDWNTAPTVPYWLPQFAPGEMAGTPMQGFAVKIPSGSLWSKTPWSQQQGLEAYINRWAGSVPGMIAAYQDLLDRMYAMFPQRAPSRATRWATPIQW